MFLRRQTVIFLLMGWLVVALGASPSHAQISGAIFTTNSACDGTDLNIYMNKQQVYSDGGPPAPGAAGLPDGEYFVQVTEPNGTLLGTSVGHPVDQTPVLVVNGEFVQCYKLCDILIRASDGMSNGCGYDDTSNFGGEYKLWISMDPNFANSLSKTDNFKVKGAGPPPPPQTEIIAIKFYDANANGVQDGGEPVIPDWHIELQLASDNSVIGCQLTDAGGQVKFLVDQDGTAYNIVETLVDPYVNATPTPTSARSSSATFAPSKLSGSVSRPASGSRATTPTATARSAVTCWRPAIRSGVTSSTRCAWSSPMAATW